MVVKMNNISIISINNSDYSVVFTPGPEPRTVEELCSYNNWTQIYGNIDK